MIHCGRGCLGLTGLTLPALPPQRNDSPGDNHFVQDNDGSAFFFLKCQYSGTFWLADQDIQRLLTSCLDLKKCPFLFTPEGNKTMALNVLGSVSHTFLLV